jgi:DNA-binding CsgD family transcriptional regulator
MLGGMASNPAKFTAHGKAGRRPDADILRLYADLGTSEAVALRAHCSAQTVRVILRAHGVPVKGRGGEPQTFLLTPEQMAALYRQGMSLARIASMAGCARSTVQNRLKGCRLERRPNSAPGHRDPKHHEPD